MNQNSKTKRIFIGIKVSGNIKDSISEWKEQHKDFPVKWIHPEDLHITLVPPWEEKYIDNAIKKLDEVQGKVQPFDIHFQKIIFGPLKTRTPSLIWAEGPSTENFIYLTEMLQRLFGVENEYEPLPHITIARFDRKDFKNFPLKTLEDEALWKQPVESIVLYKTIQTKNAEQKYHILHEVPLEIINRREWLKQHK